MKKADLISKNLSFYFLKKLVLSDRSKSLVRRISVLSFLAITISAAIFFIILFVMNGMNKNIRSRILALDPNVTAIISNPNLNSNVNSNVNLRSEQTTGFENSLRFDAYDLIIRTVDGQFRGTQATGYDEAGLKFWNQQLKNLKDKEKNYFSGVYDLDLILSEGEIAIGVDLARSLQLLEGDQVTLIPAETLLLSQMESPTVEKVTVKKILTTDLYDLDSKILLFNRNLSLRRFESSLSRTSGFHIWSKKSEDIESIKTQLLKNSNFSNVETWQDKNSDLFFALFMEKTMIGIFLGLAGLVASSSILTVLALLMTQKRRDIAIIKTLGFSHDKTLWLFIKIGLWISLSGVFLGSIVGVSVSYYLQFYPLKVLPDYYYDSSIPALVNLEFTAIVILAISSLAFLGCYFPAKATLKIHPAILLKR